MAIRMYNYPTTLPLPLLSNYYSYTWVTMDTLEENMQNVNKLMKVYYSIKSLYLIQKIDWTFKKNNLKCAFLVFQLVQLGHTSSCIVLFILCQTSSQYRS